MIVSLIAAMSENRVIGKGGGLPWRLPADLRRFKRLTSGHTVIMGRKTFESIGEQPLPGRRNIVVTRRTNVAPKGVEIARGVEEALRAAGERAAPGETVYVVGGGEIYRAAFSLADRLDLTIVHGAFEGDTFFPAFDESAWRLTSDERHEADDQHAHAYSFRVYERR